MFLIRALRNIYCYVAHQHTYTDNILAVTLSGVIIQFGEFLLVYCISILVKPSDDGRKSDRNT
jgi:hypothetical protein